MATHIETERLILRDWKEDDKKPFASMNADPMIMEYFPRRLGEDDSNKLVDRFQEHINQHGYGLYAIELKSTGAFIGFVGLHRVEKNFPFAPAVEIAWRLEYEAWGKGYATEASKAVLDNAFKKQGLDEVVAFAVYDNSRAIHIMEKLGMKHDPDGDFDYPNLPKGHPLGRFVLYRIAKKPARKS